MEMEGTTHNPPFLFLPPFFSSFAVVSIFVALGNGLRISDTPIRKNAI
jgi:hypothetical protein